MHFNKKHTATQEERKEEEKKSFSVPCLPRKSTRKTKAKQSIFCCCSCWKRGPLRKKSRRSECTVHAY